LQHLFNINGPAPGAVIDLFLIIYTKPCLAGLFHYKGKTTTMNKEIKEKTTKELREAFNDQDYPVVLDKQSLEKLIKNKILRAGVYQKNIAQHKELI
jgi:hypothetical protein